MVGRRNWVPERGDLIWLTFTPQAGREQAGRRPALVLSPALYNGKSDLAVVCPVTSHRKGYPFEVELPAGSPIRGCILSDHLKSLDWRRRQAEPIGRVRPDTLVQVINRVAPLLGL
jgi:mRNA interferase MazF